VAESRLIALIQRVTQAKVAVAGEVIADVGRGLLVLVGVVCGDSEREAEKLAERVLRYRVFADAEGRMNLSVRDVQGALLLVPQFTLAADTSGGLRPSFSTAAPPELGAALFAHLVAQVRASGVPCSCGRFGADMQVSLTNDGPVTFWLEAEPREP
jgi:D-aminoacyl-tRNA deacylase